VPISQLYLSRSGAWTVGASGRCNHVLFRDVRPTSPLADSGNSQLVGVEAQNDNRGEPWSAAMLDSYRRGVAAICRRMGWEAWRVLAHREQQSGKSDPLGIDMTAFRAAVTRLIEEDDMPTADEVAEAVWSRPNPTLGVVYGAMLRYAYNAIRPDRQQTPGARLGFLSDLDAIAAGQAAILARLDGEDDGATREIVRGELDRHRELLLGDDLAGAIADRLTDVPAEQVRLAVEQALRERDRRAAGDS
jgi:hypothetical protein